MKRVLCIAAVMGSIALNNAIAQDTVQATGSWVVVEPRHYMIDKSCKVMSSNDGTTWTVSPTNTWRDIDGTWYRVEEAQLYRSADNAAWEEVKDNRWQDVLGNQYMLTKECAVITGNAEGLQSVQPSEASPKVDQAAIAEEKRIYEQKVNQRISELEKEIAELRKNMKKQPGNKAEIESREQTRDKLKQSLADIGNKIDGEWDELKREIDRMF